MWTYLTELYNYYIERQADPRIKGFPLMESPKTPLLLVALYLMFVKVIGPTYMKNRKPLKLNGLIIAYNGFQIVFSLSIFVQVMWIWWNLGVNILCQPQVYSRTDYYALRNINISWWFLIGRFIEFADTIFFILRKKNEQVSTLHVVHHAVVPLICWLGVKLEPGGHYTFAGILNAFVHFFMYFYYLLCALGPRFKKYLWWKKYMTILQLTQFIIVFIHTVWTLASGCNVPKIFGYLILFQAMFFYKLFWDFYKGSYKRKNENQVKKVKSTFNFEKYLQKYKKIFEMCVSNQEVLLSDTQNPDKNIYLIDGNEKVAA